jgi:hypothetical protein
MCLCEGMCVSGNVCMCACVRRVSEEICVCARECVCQEMCVCVRVCVA